LVRLAGVGSEGKAVAAQDLHIMTYERQPAVCRPWDPRAVQVASLIAGALLAQMPSLQVEHVGSTAVPDCAGKGTVDLAVLYPPGSLRQARDLVDVLGFQRQQTRDPFPEQRPMRVGAIKHAGQVFQLHLHIVCADADEASELLSLRDRLRSDEKLRQAYVARKRAIIAGGVSDPLEYCYAKGRFIDDTLGKMGPPDR
jgi:GrpB-like predicted nucleotidyltransferase (UPF0157 family)